MCLSKCHFSCPSCFQAVNHECDFFMFPIDPLNINIKWSVLAIAVIFNFPLFLLSFPLFSLIHGFSFVFKIRLFESRLIKCVYNVNWMHLRFDIMASNTIHNRSIRGVPVNWIWINHPHRYQVALSAPYLCQARLIASRNIMVMLRLLVSRNFMLCNM